MFSFKIRGAYNKIASLTTEQLAAGIIACSAGNHAQVGRLTSRTPHLTQQTEYAHDQGVAMSAAKLGVDNKIIMPTGTPAIKVNAVRKFGGNVVLHGENYDEAEKEALRLVEVRAMCCTAAIATAISWRGLAALSSAY